MESNIIYISASKETHINVFELGCAYDARFMCFRDKNIFTGPPTCQDQTMEIKKMNLRYSWGDEKISFFQIFSGGFETKLHVALEALKSSGMKGSFKDNKTQHQNIVKATLFLNYTTIVEVIKKENLVVNEKVIDQKDSTHYVRSRHFGANVQIHLEYTTNSFESIQDLKGELELALDKICKGSIEAQGANNKKNNQSQIKFTVSLDGDIEMPENIPGTIDEIRLFITKELPLRIKQNNGNGIIIGYELAPLSDLEYLMTSPPMCLKGKLNDIFYSEIEYFLQQVELLQNLMTLTDRDYIAPIKDILTSEQIKSLSHMQREFDILKLELKRKIQDGLIKIKSQEDSEGELIIKDALKVFESKKIYKKIKDFTQHVQSQNKIYIDLKDLGAALVPSTSNYQQQLKSLKSKEGLYEKPKTYVLFFDGKPQDKNLQFFKTLISDQLERNEAYFIVDKVYPDFETKSSRICLYLNQNIYNPIIEDYVAQVDAKKKNYIRPKQQNKKYFYDGHIMTYTLYMRCPNSVKSTFGCNQNEKQWFCEYCGLKIFVDMNDYVQCLCFSYPLKEALFKCCDYRHGSSFISYFNELEITKCRFQSSYSNPSMIIWSSGDRFEGNLETNKKNGYGTYYWSNRNKLSCQWKDDKKNGKGVFTWSTGEIYEGIWKNDGNFGKGKLTVKGETWNIQWKDGYFEEIGTDHGMTQELKELITTTLKSLTHEEMPKMQEPKDDMLILQKIESLNELNNSLEKKFKNSEYKHKVN